MGEITFSIGDPVKIESNSRKGKVIGVDTNNGGSFYLVEFTDSDGVEKKFYYMGHELVLLEPKKKG